MHGRAETVAAILILMVSSFFFPYVRGNSTYVDVTASEARDMIDSDPLLVILDVRTQSEYNSGHIRNAKLIPHTEIEARISELDKDREILVYCHSGGRSAVASQILVDRDFTQVYNMLGGILAWMNEDYAVYVRYASVQQAIENASDGDIIWVSSGTYREHLVVNKSLTLAGENRDTTIIDGGGIGNVVLVKTVNNTFISDFTIQGCGCGCAGHSVIFFQGSHNSCIKDTSITGIGYAIRLRDSNGCVISRNIIADNSWAAIELHSSHGNIVANNDVGENSWGITIINSSDNVFYHNSIVNNSIQATVTDDFSNNWDGGYPSGGNYWSDYIGMDLHRGPYQNETGSDGIGDTPYIIDENNQDNFPLINPYIPPEELRVSYYELLEKYDDLLADIQSLNLTYRSLLMDYDNLNLTYCTLLSNYSELQGNYDSLQTSYADLQEYYDSLNSSYNELRSQQEATISELNNIRNLMYTFIVTTIILTATTVYFAKRKPKITTP